MVIEFTKCSSLGLCYFQITQITYRAYYRKQLKLADNAEVLKTDSPGFLVRKLKSSSKQADEAIYTEVMNIRQTSVSGLNSNSNLTLVLSLLYR